MAIVKDITITVKNGRSQISNDVFLYLGDGVVTLLIQVVENSTVFGSFTSTTENIVTANNSQYARICALKPDNEMIYSDKCEIIGGKIKFEISKEFIDELAEEGRHLLQIHLYDSNEDNANRLTIPPVMFSVLKPICDIGHDGCPDVAICGLAHVDSSRVTDSVTLQTFLADGSYNATEWLTGDLISVQRMNKLENGLFWNTYYNKLSVDTYNQLADIDIAYISEGVNFAYVKDDNKFYYYTEKDQWQELKTGGTDATVSLEDYAKKSEIPTKVSQLNNDKNYLTSIPNEYLTETELENKGYLTEHQDISGKADKADLHNHTNKTVLDGITSTKVTEWNNKSTFSGNYNDLTNKPTIPTKTSQLVNDSGFLTEHQDISNKLNKNLGAENAGKMLVVDDKGNIITMDVPSVGGDLVGTVVEDNNILLVGNLAAGSYVLKYENEDGTYSNVGTIVVHITDPETPEIFEGNLFNLETTKINTRVKSTGADVTENGAWITDFIPFDIATAEAVYVKNAVFIRNVSAAPAAGIGFYGENKNYLDTVRSTSSNAGYVNYTEVLGERYGKFKVNTAYTTSYDWWPNVKYIRVMAVENEDGTPIASKNDIADVIVTINKPIE